jgi:hypothetical protein
MEKRFVRDLWNIWCFGERNSGWIKTNDLVSPNDHLSKITGQ